ncbi:hypothetical protein V5O48_010414 [Marasmius crinis-equi]|uniref:Nitroreductase domain-containing protein n=1 Tax=Marasmius crinis-equi TaxID=585013 RepID=A0ABR3F8F9_9AGAR
MALSMNGCILEKDVTLVEKVDSVMKTRFSCRHYLPKPVPRRALEEIVDAARFSPSGNNMQPWEKVYCITGETLKIITDEMTKANCLNPNPHTSEYDYYPPGPLPSIYATRRQEFGKLHYGALNIAREDTEGRAKASSRN